MVAGEEWGRQRVVMAAASWINTPYHHHAMIKGPAGGVDCATLLVACFHEAGLIKPVALPPYSPQWHLHRDEQLYAEFIARIAPETQRRPPLPGDIIVWKFHRAFAHGAIVVGWPRVIHAFVGRGTFEDDALANQMLAVVSERTAEQGQPRPFKIFSLWPD